MAKGKELHHLEIHPSENGGHAVHHIYKMKQGKLPSEMIERGTDAVSKLTDQKSNGVRGDVLLNADDVPRMLNVVVSPLGVWLSLKKSCNLGLELAEMFVRPTKFHLCIGKPKSQRHGSAPLAA